MIYVIDFCIHQTQEDNIKFLIAKRNALISDEFIDGFKTTTKNPKFKMGSALFDNEEDANWFLYNAFSKFGVYFYITRYECIDAN